MVIDDNYFSDGMFVLAKLYFTKTLDRIIYRINDKFSDEFCIDYDIVEYNNNKRCAIHVSSINRKEIPSEEIREIRELIRSTINENFENKAFKNSVTAVTAPAIYNGSVVNFVLLPY